MKKCMCGGDCIVMCLQSASLSPYYNYGSYDTAFMFGKGQNE